MNVTSPMWTIEQRAEAMADQVAKISKKSGQPIHLIAHSFAGVDARYAISQMGKRHVQSLTTLCSPHRGMTLVDKALQHPAEFGDLSQSDRAFDVLGMSTRNVAEFTSKNMAAFNEVVADKRNCNYFSFGAKKKELMVNDLLRSNHSLITEQRVETETDGMVRTPDMEWGKYLLTFDHDHLEVVGFDPSVPVDHVAALMVDNLRVSEQMSQ